MNSLAPFLSYLHLPSPYHPWTQQLRWSSAGDAIDFADGSTFVFTSQLALFLEGFCSQREVPPFGMVLQMLRMLGLGGDRIGAKDVPDLEIQPLHRLRQAYLENGQRLRNAGVLFGSVLAVDLPVAVHLPPGGGNRIARWLNETPSLSALAVYAHHRSIESELAPRHASWVREQVLARLAPLAEATLQHWLRHGAAPPEPSQYDPDLADTALIRIPPFVERMQEIYTERARLSGALPLVDRLVSALTLPPRRQRPPELPLGGYADLTNRGQPQALLPSQFALDGLEFVRRFAEKELLYFRREEPHQRTRERLVILLDQGVRTWGPVRLGLSAAVVALIRLGQRKDLPLTVVCGSDASKWFDPRETPAESLAEQLEASDLSLHPGEWLATVLSEPRANGCDLVLLTHPRSLKEAAVRLACKHLAPQSRLFALTLNDTGEVIWSELRSGELIVLSRFRLSWVASPPTPAAIAAERTPADTFPSDWSGEVEPAPFPFTIGITAPLSQVAFDASGTYLLTVSGVRSPHGLLHWWRCDGSGYGLFPRPFVQGQLLREVEAVLGVEQGFVVCGSTSQGRYAFHYDLRSRQVRKFAFPHWPAGGQWRSYADWHCVLYESQSQVWAVDLQTGESSVDAPAASRARQAVERLLRQRQSPRGDRRFFPVHENWDVRFNPQTGELQFWDAEQNCRTICPLQEGKPLLVQARVWRVEQGGSQVAVLYQPMHSMVRSLLLIDVPTARVIRELPIAGRSPIGHLSPDGRWLAREAQPNQITITDTRSQQVTLASTVGRCHNNLTLTLGLDTLTLQVGEHFTHTLRWSSGSLEILPRGQTPSSDSEARIDPRTARREGALRSPQPPWDYDPGRFRLEAELAIRAIVTVFGEVLLCERTTGKLLVMLFVWRDKLALWMPDGTCYGPRGLLQTSETPNALERIGRVLFEACQLKPAGQMLALDRYLRSS